MTEIPNNRKIDGRRQRQVLLSPPIQISADDFTEIIFSDIEGYVIGTKENPVTATSIPINFAGAKPGIEVFMFHRSNTKPSFDGGSSVTIFREIGGYTTSTVNPISILFVGVNNIMVIYGNGGSSITDGVDDTSDGVITFDSPTQVDWSGFAWRKNGLLNTSGTVNDQTVTGTPADYDRIDILEGGSANDTYYKSGQESEDQPFPAITPGRVLLATILRQTDGSNSVDISPETLSDFVSKTETGIQSIKSNLAIEPLAGSIRDSMYPDTNGRISKTRADYHGVYSTVEGQTGWSRLVKIDATNNQLDFFCSLEFAGVSANFEKGNIWINFTINPDGSMSSNKLKVFGEIDEDKFTMVRVDTYIYEVYVNHDEPISFYKFRPEFSFGSSEKYTYYHQDGKDSLPAGDDFSFEKYSGGSGVESVTGDAVNNDDPSNPVMDIPEWMEGLTAHDPNSFQTLSHDIWGAIYWKDNPSIQSATGTGTNVANLPVFQEVDTLLLSNYTGVTGITNGFEGRQLPVINAGSSNIALIHDTSSGASNRFFFSSLDNYIIPPKGTILLSYVDGKWRDSGQSTKGLREVYNDECSFLVQNGSFTDITTESYVELVKYSGFCYIRLYILTSSLTIGTASGVVSVELPTNVKNYLYDSTASTPRYKAVKMDVYHRSDMEWGSTIPRGISIQNFASMGWSFYPRSVSSDDNFDLTTSKSYFSVGNMSEDLGDRNFVEFKGYFMF